MSVFGMQDIASLGGSVLDARQKAAADANAADGSFGEILKRAASTGTQAGASATTASSTAARHSMADPDQWAATHGAPAGNPAAKSAAAGQLSEYLSMPLSQRMFYTVLASMGISKEQYDSMSTEDQAKVAAQVAQRLKDNAESQQQAVDGKDSLAASV